MGSHDRVRHRPVGVPTVVAVPIERLAFSTLTMRVLIITVGRRAARGQGAPAALAHWDEHAKYPYIAHHIDCGVPK